MTDLQTEVPVAVKSETDFVLTPTPLIVAYMELPAGDPLDGDTLVITGVSVIPVDVS